MYECHETSKRCVELGFTKNALNMAVAHAACIQHAPNVDFNLYKPIKYDDYFKEKKYHHTL
jgi:hypothetical protein